MLCHDRIQCRMVGYYYNKSAREYDLLCKKDDVVPYIMKRECVVRPYQVVKKTTLQ